MVEELAGAAWLVVDSGGVELEAHVRSVDGDGHWTDHLDSVGESTFITRCDVVAGAEAGADVGGVENALAVLSGVRVAGFGVDSVVVVDVGESLGHETAVATEVAPVHRAIDELLLRKGGEGVASKSPLGLKGGNAKIKNGKSLVVLEKLTLRKPSRNRTGPGP